jgi:hypothetical protein
MISKRLLRWMRLVAFGSALWCLAGAALALPAFARQTGFECTSCHLSWPELTTVGRNFKLGGYTLIRTFEGDRPIVSFDRDANPPLVPLAAFVQLSQTHGRNVNGDTADFPREGDVVLQQASLFIAGRIAEHAGVFAQYSYDGVAHQGATDNTDLRAAGRYTGGVLDVIYGLSLNNNPTLTDIYQTTPAFGFPFANSSVAAAPAAATLIEGGLAQKVVGLNAYSMWNKSVYAEFGAYRTADKMFSYFRAGSNKASDAVLAGAAPYWRLALQREWAGGEQSASLGTYGLHARKYPDSLNPVGPTDGFRDVAFDGQYQYITDAHRFSVQLSRIRENQTLDASFASGAATNPSNNLTSASGKMSYYYNTRYGITLARFRISGGSDALAYPASANGSPESSGYVAELNWLPWRDRRFTVQYTKYAKFNGASTNYDGNGRNARDNDTLYLLAWFAF